MTIDGLPELYILYYTSIFSFQLQMLCNRVTDLLLPVATFCDDCHIFWQPKRAEKKTFTSKRTDYFLVAIAMWKSHVFEWPWLLFPNQLIIGAAMQLYFKDVFTKYNCSDNNVCSVYVATGLFAIASECLHILILWLFLPQFV